MENKSALYSILLAATLFLFFGIYLLVTMPPLSQKNDHSTSTITHGMSQASLSLLEKALQAQVYMNTQNYSGKFEIPFKKNSRTPTAASRGIITRVERQKLFLKGLLLKKAPLAILQDERGETFIRGIGERVFDQQIQKIGTNSVILKDSYGTFELTVEEN